MCLLEVFQNFPHYWLCTFFVKFMPKYFIFSVATEMGLSLTFPLSFNLLLFVDMKATDFYMVIYILPNNYFIVWVNLIIDLFRVSLLHKRIKWYRFKNSNQFENAKIRTERKAAPNSQIGIKVNCLIDEVLGTWCIFFT